MVAAAVDGGSGCGGDDDDDEDDGSAAAAAAVWSTVPCEREGKWSSRLRGQGRKWVLPERRRRRKSGVLPVERRQRQKGRPRATGRMPVEPRVGIGLSLPTFLARHFALRE